MRLIWLLVIGMVLPMVSAGGYCPYTGYVPGRPGILVSGNETHAVVDGKLVRMEWEDIEGDFCWGVCPADIKAVQDAWVPVNVTGKWSYHDGQWWEQYWKCEDAVRDMSLVQDCRMYERSTTVFINHSQGVGGSASVVNATNSTANDFLNTQTKKLQLGYLSLDVKDFVLAITKVMIG